MGRRTTADELLAQAKARGYRKGAHADLDSIRNRQKHVKKTQRDQDRTLRRYVLWHLAIQRDALDHQEPLPTEETARRDCLYVGVAAPDLVTVKDFLRFYIATSSPQITNIPTVDSINTVAEWFFAGFTRVTGTETDEEERSEVYNWVRKVLTLEGVVVTKRRPKHNFQEQDLIRLLLTLWMKDDLIYIPERYRVQFTFILRVYCWTGARLSAFFTDGLRYRDIDLALQRTATGGWRTIYILNQRWVKNNRDPENVVFGAAGCDHDLLIYDDSCFLLTMALADEAIFGYETLADLQEQQIPAGDSVVKLRFKDKMLTKPILRKCTKADGVTDDPMPKSAFLDILRSTMRNAGYLCTASIHAIRRQLGKKVDENYTEVQRSQHLTQADPRIFGQSYVANISTVNGQAAFLGEKLDHSHIDYFQSLEKFRESGLPCELPAHIEQSLRQDSRRQELELEVQIETGEKSSRLKESKSRLTKYVKHLKADALRKYQKDWIQQRRDWKIVTRGKEQAPDVNRTDLVENLCLLFPERARIAQMLASKELLTEETRWLAMADLITLCKRDSPVLYLPDCQPVKDCCPVQCCQLELAGLPRGNRNQHIQACKRREIASKQGFLQSDVHYCYLCFSWVVGDSEWETHCSEHLHKLTLKRCGTIKYCHTIVRPGYCPFCLWCASDPEKRLASWCRDQALWGHIETHIVVQSWPRGCPDPRCQGHFADAETMQFHFIDEHGLPRPGKCNSAKRKLGDELFVIQPESPWSTVPAKKRCRKPIAMPLSLAKPADRPASVNHEPLLSISASLCPSPLDEPDKTSFGVRSDFDDMAPIVGSTVDSTDSTLLNSPVWDDSLFDSYLRSPSPEGDSSLVTHQAQEDLKPESGLDMVNLPDVNIDADDSACDTQKPADMAGKLNIRLRLGVKPTLAPSATKIVLRCSTRQGKGQHERKIESVKTKPVKTKPVRGSHVGKRRRRIHRRDA